jgi:transposase
LNYLDKLYCDTWTKDFKNLILDALKLKKELSPSDYLQPLETRMLLENRLNKLLSQSINNKYEKLITFKNRIVNYREYLFQFLYHCQVPADNNGSERAVRNFKVKQKISGLFRSVKGAKDFAVIRSIIDTTIKNSQNVLEALWIIPKVRAE